MDVLDNPFRARLKSGGGIPLGTWLMSGAASTAEAMGSVGFDWVVIDMEHVPIEVRDTYHILQAVAGTPAIPVVRLAWNDMVLIKRVLDIGAQTIMVPFVQTAQEARQAVAATRYPAKGSPINGVRGFAAVHRASRYGTATDYARRANDSPFVIIQLETPEAIANLEAIAAEPGVDAIFLGPGDLSVAMGYPGNLAADELQAAIADVAMRCGKIGKPCGIVGPTPEMVERFVGYGYTFVAVASDMGMMMRQANAFISALRPKIAKAVATGVY